MMPLRLATWAMVAVFLLGGCAAPVPRIVRVPVPVPCEVGIPVEPDWATRDIGPQSTIYEKVRALLAERRQRIAYEAELKAVIEACRSPLEPAALRP